MSIIEVKTPCSKCGIIVIFTSRDNHNWDEITRRTDNAICALCQNAPEPQAFPMTSPTDKVSLVPR